MKKGRTVLNVLHGLLPQPAFKAYRLVNLAGQRYQSAIARLNVTGIVMLLLLTAIAGGHLLGAIDGFQFVILVVLVAAVVIIAVSSAIICYRTLGIAKWDYNALITSDEQKRLVEWRWVADLKVTYAPSKVLVVFVRRTGEVVSMLVGSNEAAEFQHWLDQHRISMALPIVGLDLPVLFSDLECCGVDFAVLLAHISRFTGWNIDYARESDDLRAAALHWIQDSRRVGAR